MRMPAIISVIQKGMTPLKTFIGDMFVIEATISDTTPTGGVRRPVLSMIIVIIPNHIPLKPMDMTIG